MHEHSAVVTAAQHCLVLVTHGTRSDTGLRTTRELCDAVAAARPGSDVALCYLDVAEPTLADVLAADARPAVVVPALLSTGYHVQFDIPAAIDGRPDTLLARHLGPHPLLVDAMLDRLDPAGPAADEPAVTTVLVGAGSTRPEAHTELAAVAAMVGARTGGDVAVLTMADDLPTALAAFPRPLQVVTYLLAEGQFTSTLQAAAGAGTRVGAPIGVHPALVELVWARFDEASTPHPSERVG